MNVRTKMAAGCLLPLFKTKMPARAKISHREEETCTVPGACGPQIPGFVPQAVLWTSGGDFFSLCRFAHWLMVSTNGHSHSSVVRIQREVIKTQLLPPYLLCMY